MQGRSWLLNAALGLVKWSPALQEHLRLEMVGLGGRSEDGEAMSPRLRQLIQDDRNGHVMTELDRILKSERGHRRIAIFYGAAHLQDMERRLKARGYRPAEPVRWDSAIHAHPYAAGIRPDEVREALGG